jgi:hypothetical protein
MSSRSRTWLAIYARALANMARGGGPATDPPRRILLPHHSLLGDTVLLAACIAKLRARHPGAEIVRHAARSCLFAGGLRRHAGGLSARDPTRGLWARP